METINYYKIKSLIEVLITDKLNIIFQVRFERKYQCIWDDSFMENATLVLKDYKFGSSLGQEAIEVRILKTPTDQLDELKVNIEDEERRLDIEESKLLLDGRLHNFTFSLLSKLLLYWSDPETDATIDGCGNRGNNCDDISKKQNEIINKIYKVYLDNIKTIKSDFKLNTDLFHQIKYQLVKLMNDLSSSIYGMNEEDDMVALTDLFNTSLNVNNNQDNHQQNYQQQFYSSLNEELLDIERECNEHYNNGKFKKAYKSAKQVWYLDCLDNDSKSHFCLKSSKYLLEYQKCRSNKLEKKGQSDCDNTIYKSLVKADKFAKLSIVYKPTSSASYYQLGMVSSKLSRYSIAIECYQASLLLDSSQTNKELVISSLRDASRKLSIINRSLKPNGTRDFEKETNLMLDEVLQFNNLIKKYFKERLTRDYCKSIFTKVKNFTSNFIKSGLSEQKALHFNLLLEVGKCLSDWHELDRLEQKQDGDINYYIFGLNQQNKSTIPLNRKQCIEVLGRLVSSGCELSIVYQLLYQEACSGFEGYSSMEWDTRLLIALLMKMTTLSIPFVSIKSVRIQNEYFYNYNSVIAMERLGSLYRCGLYSLDIDMEKAVYYYKRSIAMDRKLGHQDLSELNCTGFSYFALGIQYFDRVFARDYSDRFSIRFNMLKENYKLARELWEKGASIQNVEFQSFCINKLEKLDSLSSPSSPSSLSSPKSRGHNSTKNDKGHIKTPLDKAIYSLKSFDLGEASQPLNFLEIKRTIEKGSSVYSTQVYEIFTSINSFIKSFESYQSTIDIPSSSPSLTKRSSNNSNNVQDKIQLLRPLADIYSKSPEFHFAIRVPKKFTIDLKNFVEELLDREPSNSIVKLCYLGLFKFDQDKIAKLLEISKSSSPDHNHSSSKSINSSEFEESKYQQAFSYYYVTFLVYNGEIQDGLKQCLYYARKFGNSSYYFNYFAFKILFSMDPKSEACKQLLSTELYFEMIKRGTNQITQISTENPITCFYYYIMSAFVLMCPLICHECQLDNLLPQATACEKEFAEWLTKHHFNYLKVVKSFVISILGCICCYKSKSNTVGHNHNHSQN